MHETQYVSIAYLTGLMHVWHDMHIMAVLKGEYANEVNMRGDLKDPQQVTTMLAPGLCTG